MATLALSAPPQEVRQGRQCGHPGEGGVREHRSLRTRGAVEHPCRNFQPAIRSRIAQSAPENEAARLLYRLPDPNPAVAPWMPPIQQFLRTVPVGVVKPCCTTR